MNKNIDWVKQNFKTALQETICSEVAAQAMYDGKLELISDSLWEDLVDWVNWISFPLTIFRGLRVSDKDSVNMKSVGINWTTDATLFYEKSAFFDCNIILVANIDEDSVDWPATIQNYIYYSLEPKDGIYPEEEITLKRGYDTISNLKNIKV